jgi:isoleucyl-tRNA synthetase
MKELMSYLQPVEPAVDLPALEREVLATWAKDDTFRKSVEQRPVARSYVFYDGPPFATGLPHYGHILTSVIKDLIPRFQTMCGQRVERRFGWDCHGVPAEYETERALGLEGKDDIERMGMAAFNEACRSTVLRYTQEWEKIVTRIGRWVDFQNDYKTMDPSFMESVWWAFKRLWEAGLIYRDYKVVHYSWRLSTSYSNFEATLDDAYREREDPAVVVPFRLDGEEAAYLMAWTTTPWTLPSNMALAVGPDTAYRQVRSVRDGREADYVVASSRVNDWFPRGTYEVVAELEGRALVGKTYRPLFPYFAHLKDEGAFVVVGADFVSTKEGTGVVHLAPAFGEDDFYAAKAAGIPLVNPVDDVGRFTAEVPDFAGMNVFDANPAIVDQLATEGKLFAQHTVVHPYPHDWRTDTPLIYRAVPSWYVDVTALKERMLAVNAQINWVPAHLGQGAFNNWLANARDWAISRSRYWGTPIPAWECAACGHTLVVGSVAELEERAGVSGIMDLHRHFIDSIAIPCPECGASMRRVPEVLDCWFESGSMPYGQAHYPFENKAWFEDNFPADFIVEYTGQIRGWFYTLVVLSTALFDRPPFKNAVVHGVTLGDDGRKMSKRLRNYPDPEEIADEYGADTLRLYLMDHPVLDARDSRIEREGVVQVYRRFTLPLWNAFSFFTRYAAADGWRPAGERHQGKPLDRWIRSLVYELAYRVADALRAYELREATALLTAFVDDLTNWYIRRSRQRFWKSEHDDDKAAAYETLYEVLVVFSKIAAPTVPFLAEVMFRNLTGGGSVHLEDWPTPDRSGIDAALNRRMAAVRQAASLGLAARAKAGIKVRQPLATARVHANRSLDQADLALLADELNVKAAEQVEDVGAYADPVARLNLSVVGPRFGPETPRIAAAARAGDFHVRPDGRVVVAGDEAWTFEPDLVRVHYESKPGYACETAGDMVVVLDTRLTEALRREGLARDLVRHIQELRKEAGCRLDERVVIGVVTDDPAVRRCLAEFGDDIRAETLAETLVTEPWPATPDPCWTVTRTIQVDGAAAQLAVRRHAG